MNNSNSYFLPIFRKNMEIKSQLIHLCVITAKLLLKYYFELFLASEYSKRILSKSKALDWLIFPKTYSKLSEFSEPVRRLSTPEMIKELTREYFLQKRSNSE